MFKNVSLRKRSHNGQHAWVLLGPDGQPIPAFSAFVYTLRNDAKNTLRAFIRRFPQSPHINDAKGKLAEVQLYH